VERELFTSVLTAPDLSFFIFYIFGPGGIGKTWLLREFGYMCRQSHITYTYVDLRDVQPSPQAFIQALREGMSLPLTTSPLDQLAAETDRHVLLIDTYETLAPLSGWLRKEFFPQLSENIFVVIAGRDTSSLAWQMDAGWRELVRFVALRNFSSEESQLFLTKRNIPLEHHQIIRRFTHGHPLALSLIADEFAQQGERTPEFNPETTPNLIKALLERLIQKLPGPIHRAALEACAQVRLMTEPLLARMLDIPDARELFDWLRGLSFVESGPHGIFLHDLAGKALAVDLRWRNRELYDTLLKRARAYYTDQLHHGDMSQQQQIIVDYIFLHRHNPVVQPFLDVPGPVSVVTDVGRESDWSALISMVEQQEGQTSAKLAEHWLKHQPGGVMVVRNVDVEAEPHQLGLLLTVALEQATPETIAADPATAAAWRYLQQHAPLRAEEKAVIFRFWLAHDTYQDLSIVQSLIGVNMVRFYLTAPNLAFTFFPCADPDFWAPLCAYANLHRLPEADFEVEGHHYGVYGHDWRVVPPLKWLDLLAERETMLTTQPPAPPKTETLVVLSQSDFAEAVWDALREFTNPEALRANPLLRSRLIMEAPETPAQSAERITRLQEIIQMAAESLQSSPRQAKYYRALYRTYLNPAPTQEKAAEILDLPFSTFRRHLKSGLTEVTEILWQQEIGG
jgi:hypothetical protein